MTAPDRIWAWYDCDEDGWDNAYATTIDNIPHSSEYVRLDLHAALQAENERLRRTLEDISDQHCPSEPASWGGTEYDWVMRQYGKLRSLARAALK